MTLEILENLTNKLTEEELQAIANDDFDSEVYLELQDKLVEETDAYFTRFTEYAPSYRVLKVSYIRTLLKKKKEFILKFGGFNTTAKFEDRTTSNELLSKLFMGETINHKLMEASPRIDESASLLADAVKNIVRTFILATGADLKRNRLFCEDFDFKNPYNISVLESINKLIASYGERTGLKTRKVTSNMKITRFLTQLTGTDYLATEFSKLVDKGIKGNLIYSVHPVEFLSMSDGNSWSSCHSVRNEGEYCLGALSYILDDCSVIAYVGDTLSKRKRSLVFAGVKEGKLTSLIVNKAYPDNKGDFMSQVKLGLEEKFNQAPIESDIEAFVTCRSRIAYLDMHNSDSGVTLMGVYAKEVEDLNPSVSGLDCIVCGNYTDESTMLVCHDCHHDTIICETCGESIYTEQDYYYEDNQGCIHCEYCAIVDHCYECDYNIKFWEEHTVFNGEHYCECCTPVCEDCGQTLDDDNVAPDNILMICIDCEKEGRERDERDSDN